MRMIEQKRGLEIQFTWHSKLNKISIYIAYFWQFILSDHDGKMKGPVHTKEFRTEEERAIHVTPSSISILGSTSNLVSVSDLDSTSPSSHHTVGSEESERQTVGYSEHAGSFPHDLTGFGISADTVTSSTKELESQSMTSSEVSQWTKKSFKTTDHFTPVSSTSATSWTDSSESDVTLTRHGSSERDGLHTGLHLNTRI